MTDIITLIANVALALSFVIGLIFGIAQVNTANRDRRERLTIETLRNFQTREFAELILFINSHNMPSNSKEMNALPPTEQVFIVRLCHLPHITSGALRLDHTQAQLLNKRRKGANGGRRRGKIRGKQEKWAPYDSGCAPW